MSLSDLIVRLEAAVEGSRVLDGAIALAIGWQHKGVGNWVDLRGDSWWTLPMVDAAFSTRIDAALTLVREGWMYDLHGALPTEKEAWPCYAHVYYYPNAKFRGEAKTVPLALCIAALKVREASS